MCLYLLSQNMIILVGNFSYSEHDTLGSNSVVNPFVMKFIFLLKNHKLSCLKKIVQIGGLNICHSSKQFKQSVLRLFSFSIPKTMTVGLCFESREKTVVYLRGKYRLRHGPCKSRQTIYSYTVAYQTIFILSCQILKKFYLLNFNTGINLGLMNIYGMASEWIEFRSLKGLQDSKWI